MTPASTIFLRPPEKLVLEVISVGDFNYIFWQRNGVTFSVAPNTAFSVTLQELPHFFEIFVREPTTADDVGVYVAALGLNTIVLSDLVIFRVIGTGIEIISFHISSYV